MGTFGTAVVMAFAATTTAFVNDTPEPMETTEPVVAEQMLQRNNELRASVGLTPHQLSAELNKAAQDHAEYMARTGQFSHYVNGGPSDRAARHGYSGSVRENIAMGYGSVGSAFAGWQSSGGHWASIVSGTADAGFGYAVGPGGTPYWVGVYGYPAQKVLKPVLDDNDDESTQVQENASSNNVTYTTQRTRRRRVFGRRRR